MEQELSVPIAMRGANVTYRRPDRRPVKMQARANRGRRLIIKL
jgi:hypothetical protein